MIRKIWSRTGYPQLLWWVILLAWMGLIFLMSAQDGEESAALSGGIVNWLVQILLRGVEDMEPDRLAELKYILTVLIRKLAHFTEYAVLAGIGMGLLHSYGCLSPTYSGMVWLGATLYAVTDEIHQGFTAGRAPRAFDVCIDSAGALFGVLVIYVLLVQHRRRKARQK